MKVEILGDGCAKCQRLQDNVSKALGRIPSNDVEVTVTGSPERLAHYSLLTLPALAIEGKVVVKGDVPDVDEIIKLLS